MTLKDILLSIEEEAKNKIESLKREAESKKATINKKWQAKFDAEKELYLKQAKKEINNQIFRTQFRLKSQNQAQVLTKKKEIIDRVFKQALKDLSEINESEYIILLVKLIKQLPKTDGKLISTAGKESLLKKALAKSGREYEITEKTVPGKGGFIFQSTEIEIDNTFETLIDNQKRVILTEVAKILFNK